MNLAEEHFANPTMQTKLPALPLHLIPAFDPPPNNHKHTTDPTPLLSPLLLTTNPVHTVDTPVPQTPILSTTSFVPAQHPNIIPDNDDSCSNPVVRNTVSKPVPFDLTLD